MCTLRNALITASAAMALVLAGCGGDSKVSSDELDGEPGISQDAAAWKFEPGTYPRFDPASSDLPLNTDLVFSEAATTDGTANVGMPSNAAEDAINDLDGWSTSAYFDIRFAGGELDSSTVCTDLTGMVCGPPNVFVLELDTGSGDALDIANIQGVVGPASISASVESLDGGTDNVLRIYPEATFNPSTKYLVFVTDSVQDKSGNSITRSFQYNLIGDPEPDISSSLQPVRQAIQGWEQVANGFLASQTIPASVAISYTFTTTEPQTPLTAMGAPRAAVTQVLIEAGQSQGDAATAAGNLEAGGFLSTPKERDIGVNPNTGVDLGQLTEGQLPSSVAKLYTGYIKLPYYLQAPGNQGQVAGANKPFWGQEFWRPDETLASQLGQSVPEDTDGSKNVTYRYPFAAQKSTESFPLQVILPVDTDNGGANGCDGGNYPVAIYIHGITSDRTSGVSLAHTLASQCIATVAIDLPVHGVAAANQFAGALNVDRGDLDGESGPLPDYQSLYGGDAPRERHFEVVQDASNNPVPMDFGSPNPEVDTSGAWFINLGTLQNTRDNMRQAVMDLLNLNASLDAISALNLDGEDGDDLDTGNINVVGHSLGAIIGSVYATMNQKVIQAESNAGFTANVNPVQGAVLSAGGSQVSQVLVNSNTFRPIINAGLQANGVEPGTSNYERFLYAAQSTVASADPVNFVDTLNAFSGSPLEVPAMYQQIKDDNVVPNMASITGAPLAGTEPMALTLGGATQVGAGGPYDFSSAGMGPGLVVLDDLSGDSAGHASLLTPNESTSDAQSITAEMQAQVLQFVGSNGTNVGVDPQASGAIVDP